MTDENPQQDETELSSQEEPTDHGLTDPVVEAESIDDASSVDEVRDPDASVEEQDEHADREEARDVAAPVAGVDESSFDNDDESTALSNGALAFVAFAALVLVAGGIFVAGSFFSQGEETATAQAEAESQIAEYNPDEFVSEFTQEELSGEAEPEAVIVEPTPTTVPDAVALADETDADQNAEAEEATDPAADEAEEVGEEIDTTIPLIDPNDTALVFINRVPGDEYGFVGYVNLAGERFITPLSCDRLDWNRNGGVCLQGGSIGSPGRGLLLDEFLRPVRRFGIATPSRAAISPDGGTVSWTGFVTGHDYLAAGEFATTTQLIDVERELGAELQEDFETYISEDETLSSEDQNYWGTTYIDNQTFYATVGFEGQTNLVFGDVRTGRLDIVHENASCPEVSPNGSTIVAKEQRDQSFQLVAINAATGERRDLNDARSVDDQVEWVDDNTIVYGLPNPDAGTTGQPALDIWVLNVNDGSAPRLLLAFADSPAAP